MIIDIRYHIASLVAVFLALGIGIFIGSALVGDRLTVEMVDQQKELIQKLEGDFQILRQQKRDTELEVAAFKNSTSIYEDFIKKVMPVIIQERLMGLEIAVIQTENLSLYKSEQLEERLKDAGARIHSHLNFVSTDDPLPDESLRRLRSFLGLKAEATAGEVKKAAIEKIAASLARGNQFELSFLSDNGLITFTGQCKRAPDAVIIFGGSYDQQYHRVKNLDVPLIKSLKKYDIPVYAVEEEETPYSAIKYYMAEGLSTVDNIDTYPGQVAMVLMLEGRPGHYGEKSTAQSLLPNLE